jgi:hypothetical protein
MKVEELASSRASTTRQAFPSPSNCPNVSSGVIARHHLVGVKPPPVPTGNSEEPVSFTQQNSITEFII